MTIEQLSEKVNSTLLAKRGDATLFLSRRILKIAALAASVFCFQGCGERNEPPETTKQAVKFDEVPELVCNAARKAIPGVDLKDAWKNLDREGKLHSYEIRGKNSADGKTREVRVSLTGEILELE